MEDDDGDDDDEVVLDLSNFILLIYTYKSPIYGLFHWYGPPCVNHWNDDNGVSIIYYLFIDDEGEEGDDEEDDV